MKFPLLLLSILSFGFYANGQQIHSLPAGLVTLDEEKADTAIIILHNFLEEIRGSQMVESITSTDFTYSSTRWSKGSWGNGYFTDHIQIPDYLGTARTYDGWYIEPDLYNSCRPMVRDAGRVITAYLNLFGSGMLPDTLIKSRIIKGVEFLLADQLQSYVFSTEVSDGAFMWWGSRPGLTTPNAAGFSDTGQNIRPEQFDTGFAVEALTSAYYFFEKNSIDNASFVLEDIKESIDKAGAYALLHSGAHNTYTSTGCTHVGWSRNTNQLTCSIWTLVNAYKVTRNSAYLTGAINAFNRSVSALQDSEGTWTYYICPGGSIDYHDSQGHYTGIILRNMVELYDQVSCDDFTTWNGIGVTKDNLKRQILSTINHFLDPGISKYYDGVRLRSDGQVADYRLFDPSQNEIDIEVGLFDGLVNLSRSELFNEFSVADQIKIEAMQNAILQAGVVRVTSVVPQIGNWAEMIRSLSYYKRKQRLASITPSPAKVVLYSSAGDTDGDNKIGIYNIAYERQTGYSNISGDFDLMTTGNFDDDSEDEIVVYSRDDGKITIYNPGFLNYTGCEPVHVATINTGYNNYDLMEVVKYIGSSRNIVMYSIYDGMAYNRVDVFDLHGLVSHNNLTASNTFALMAAGDFDQDGSDEIALYSRSDGKIEIYNTDLMASSPYARTTPVYGGQIATGFTLHDHMEALDFDNDGYRDELVMHNRTYAGSNNRIDILDTSGYISSRYSNAGSLLDALATGDFDNDGRDELAFYASSDGQVSLYNPEFSTSVAYTGSSPIYSGSIYTQTTNYVLMSPLIIRKNDRLQTSARQASIKSESPPSTRGEDRFSLIVYPIPTTGRVTIDCSIVQRPTALNITISDLMGQVIDVIAEEVYSPGNHRFSYSNERLEGLYLINVNVNGIRSETTKVIFRK